VHPRCCSAMITMALGIEGLLPRVSLSEAQRDEMHSLLTTHFDGVTRSQFERDLEEKNWIVEIRRAGRLVGFSTLLVCEVEFDGRPLTAIYSGDTIVTPEAWGSPTLARTWIAAVNYLRGTFPARPCYWLLLTSGFRTYRFLPVFWREFFPRFSAPTPRHYELLLQHLARARYGNWHDEDSGIVRFPRPQKLRGRLGMVPSGRTTDAHVAFFLSRNPRHFEGDELVCLTEISETNLTRAGRRMISDSSQ
jgi:hypothetical protein